MIQTVKEYKEAHSLTWLKLAHCFGANNYQEAQQWSKNGWLIVTYDGMERLVSVRRSRTEA
jgi:hypothetical protein